jgi:hypothetical protein
LCLSEPKGQSGKDDQKTNVQNDPEQKMDSRFHGNDVFSSEDEPIYRNVNTSSMNKIWKIFAGGPECPAGRGTKKCFPVVLKKGLFLHRVYLMPAASLAAVRVFFISIVIGPHAYAVPALWPTGFSTVDTWRLLQLK